MPLEIRELYIKVNVTDDESAATTGVPLGDDKERQDELIKACVDQVLEILKEQQQR